MLLDDCLVCLRNKTDKKFRLSLSLVYYKNSLALSSVLSRILRPNLLLIGSHTHHMLMVHCSLHLRHFLHLYTSGEKFILFKIWESLGAIFLKTKKSKSVTSSTKILHSSRHILVQLWSQESWVEQGGRASLHPSLSTSLVIWLEQSGKTKLQSVAYLQSTHCIGSHIMA